MLGFKRRCSSHDKKNHLALAGENHEALGLPLPCSEEVEKQDVAAMQSSLLAVWKNAGGMLQEGKG